MEEVKAQADKDQANYDALNFRDDQFDLSDALIAIAISLLAVSSLTGLPWLYGIALVPSDFCIMMGMAGLLDQAAELVGAGRKHLLCF